MNAVDEEVKRSEPRCQEGAPPKKRKSVTFGGKYKSIRYSPPVVILGTKMEVAQEDSRLRAGNDQDDEDQKEKAKHIVSLIGPNTVQ